MKDRLDWLGADGLVQGETVPGCRALSVGADYRNLVPCVGQRIGQRPNAHGKDAVVVAKKKIHGQRLVVESEILF